MNYNFKEIQVIGESDASTESVGAMIGISGKMWAGWIDYVLFNGTKRYWGFRASVVGKRLFVDSLSGRKPDDTESTVRMLPNSFGRFDANSITALQILKVSFQPFATPISFKIYGRK